MKKIIIAIDGYSGCGKSTTAKELSKILDYTYIDSGAMYRAATYYFLKNHITLTNPRDVQRALVNMDIELKINPETKVTEIYLNGLNVEKEIRNMEVNHKVSEVSTLSAVRKKMVALQRKLAKKKGVVMDGRDIGTVVLPDADLKLFMTADIKIRAERRQKELLEKGALINIDEVEENLRKRDHLDTSRELSPLKKADDAIEIDTTFMTFDEQVEKAANLASSKIIDKNK